MLCEEELVQLLCHAIGRILFLLDLLEPLTELLHAFSRKASHSTAQL
jgi:hypothetical protein